jgi:hypothetical protein
MNVLHSSKDYGVEFLNSSNHNTRSPWNQSSIIGKRNGTEEEKDRLPGKEFFRAVQHGQIIEVGIQISSSSAATLPQVWQENFIAASLPLQTWLILTSSIPQKEQEIFSVVGLQR